MSDREKMIRAIERAQAQSKEYAQDRIFVPFKEADIIISLLKEKEPVAPFHECVDGLYPYTLVRNKDFMFCPYCGRKVKWND